ncbi:MAG: inositol monophosphatase, partial [Candidatus Binatia bacterium]
MLISENQSGMAMLSSQVKEVMQVAGRIAVNLYGRERGELKADGTWVTRADGVLEDFLRGELVALCGKEISIFGEESGWTGNDDASIVAIIDPIDGTDLFRKQIPVWGISLALFRRNKRDESWTPWLGLFSLPAANQLFVGEYDQGAQWNDQPLTTSVSTIPIPQTACLGVSSDAHQWDLRGYPGKVRAFGVSGYQVALVATDALQAALLTRFHFYDIAGAAIVLWTAGGEL